MEKATKVFKNGYIVTVDQQNKICESLALCGNKILKVGTENEILPYLDAQTEIVDLQGKTVLPGFYDSHGHMSMAGEAFTFSTNLSSPPTGKMETIEDCLEALCAFGERMPDSKNITGFAYDDTLIAEKRGLYRQDLDKVTTERPVWVAQASGHIGYANSKLLEMLGYTKDTPNPEGGVIQKDPVTGEPNGILEETAKQRVQMDPEFCGRDNDPERPFKAISFISQMYAEVGVTTASEGGGRIPPSVLQNLVEASHRNLLKIRVIVNPPSEYAADWYQIPIDTDKVTVGGTKIMYDGSIQAYTGYLSKPYYTAYRGDETYCGYASKSKEKLFELVEDIYAHGRQVLCHCNGDAAIEDYLEAIEAAQKLYPREDDRPVVIHAQMSRRDQIKKMHKINAIPSFFLLHTYYWGDQHVNIFLGPERGSRISPAKWAVEEGIPFTTHCDTPVVPQTPLRSIWAAVNRKTFQGTVIGAEQRVEVLDAIKSYTIHAAYQNYEESIKGSIEPGKYADLVILAENPLHCDPDKIKDIEVLETIVGGETVYKK